MTSLFFKNLFFFIIHPGLVTGLIPYWILGERLKEQSNPPFQTYQFPGMVVFLIGLVILSHCIFRFATEGRGTLSPVVPTKELVIKGLYRFSRNPMYVGVVLILVGEAIFFRSNDLWIYLIIVFLIFNLFIVLFEEPRLRKDFGDAYQAYCKKVRRWL